MNFFFSLIVKISYLSMRYSENSLMTFVLWKIRKKKYYLSEVVTRICCVSNLFEVTDSVLWTCKSLKTTLVLMCLYTKQTLCRSYISRLCGDIIILDRFESMWKKCDDTIHYILNNKNYQKQVKVLVYVKRTFSVWIRSNKKLQY